MDWAEGIEIEARDPVAFGKEQARSSERYFQEPMTGSSDGHSIGLHTTSTNLEF